MKKIIDAGALRSAQLEQFLSDSMDNYAVLSDYASMESFKGNGHINIRKSLRILAQYPERVIVLKSTGAITRMPPKKKGLRYRMVDQAQTSNFKHYCTAIFTENIDPVLVANDIRSKQNHANEHFAKLAVSAETIRAGIAAIISTYPEADLKALKNRSPVSEQFTDRVIRDIMNITAIHFRDASNFSEMPSANDARYSFPFRYAVSSYALVLKWIADQGYGNVPVHKLRNDFTDATYAAYATFFDGIITKDRKLNEIYNLAEWMLFNLFSVPKESFDENEQNPDVHSSD